MSDEILAAILTKVTAVSDDVSSLKADMRTLVGNGKKGRVDLLEDGIDDLKASKNWMWGSISSFCLVITGWEFFKHFFGAK